MCPYARTCTWKRYNDCYVCKKGTALNAKTTSLGHLLKWLACYMAHSVQRAPFASAPGHHSWPQSLLHSSKRDGVGTREVPRQCISEDMSSQQLCVRSAAGIKAKEEDVDNTETSWAVSVNEGYQG